MSFFIKSTVVLFPAFFILSCGIQSAERTDRELYKKQDSEPKQYLIRDKECLDKATQDKNYIKTASIYNNLGAFKLQPSATEVKLASSKSLESSFVSLTTFESLWVRECRSHNCQSIKDSNQMFHLKGIEKKLRVCQKNSSFDRLAIETVAITSAYYLTKAFNVYQERWGREVLSQIQLSIFPLYQSKIYSDFDMQKYQSSWETNNIAYYARTKKVAIYPRAKNTKNTNLYLWESPFVLSHEFAHHMEHEVTGIQSERSWKNTNLSVKKQLIMNSFSEGFADLIALYIQDESPKSLEKLSCFVFSRNPMEPAFADSLTKSLTEGLLSSFLTSKEPRKANCDVAYPGNIYSIGSIFSHTAFKVISLLSHDLSEKEKKELQFKIAIRWTKKVHRRLGVETNALENKIFILDIVRVLERISKKYIRQINFSLQKKEELNRDICKQIKSSFPWYNCIDW